MKPLLRLSLAAIVAAILVHLAALDNPFVYDDHRLVLDNTSIRHGGDLRAVVLYEMTRPVPNLSYAADFAWWGLAPFGYHLTNLLLHLLNVALFARLTWRLGEDASAAQGWPRDVRGVAVAAWGATLLLAIHPLLASAVGYVAARPELLCAIGVQLALLAGRRWLGGGGTAWGLATVGAWLLALLSKEVAVMVPVLLLAMDAWLWAPAARRGIRWPVHAGLLGATVAAAALRLAVLARLEYGGGGASMAWDLLPAQFDVVRRYFGLLLLPNGQTIFHDVPLSTWSDGGPLVGVALVAVMLAGAWALRRAAPIASLGGLWFLLLLAPSAVLVLLDRAEPMAEHRVYVASLGAFLIAGTAASALSGLRPPTDRAWSRLLLAVGVVLLLALGARTALRHVVWASPIGVWTEARDAAPESWVPRQGLGEALLEAGRVDDAIVELTAAVTLRPEEPAPYQKLALAELAAGRPGDAAAVFERLRARDPRSPVAANGLGALALATGRRDQARRHFDEALALDPANVPARLALAAMAEQPPADAARALQLCREAQQLAPGTAGADECIRRNQARLDAGAR